MVPKQSCTCVIIRLSALGDVVLTTAALHFLQHLSRQSTYDFRVLWVCKEPFASLLRSLFPHITVIPYSEVGRRGSAALQQALQSADFFLDAQRNRRSWALRLRFYLRYRKPIYRVPKYRTKRWLLIIRASLRGRSRVCNSATVPQVWHVLLGALKRALIREGYLQHDLLRTLPPVPTAFPPHLVAAPLASGGEVASLLSSAEISGGLLSVTLGAAHVTKQAPVALLATILNATAQRLGCSPTLVLLGSAKERERGQELRALLRWPGAVVDLCARTSLVEVAAVLQASRRVLCHDTGLFHMAEALGTEVAVLFGPTWQAGGFAPHLPSSKSFFSSLGCRPCSRHGKRSCRYADQLCFGLIDTDAVAEHLAQGWTSTTTSTSCVRQNTI